jgi:hypothetical protein
MKSLFSRSSFCDFDASQLANTSCNKAQSAVHQCLSALSQHSVSTLSALCQRYVWTFSAFKQYSESLSGLIQSLSGLGQHDQSRIRIMSGVVWGCLGCVSVWSALGLGLSGVGLGLVWGWSGVVSTLSALFHRIVLVLLSN